MGSNTYLVEYHRLTVDDAATLAAFYNALGDESKRLFQPLSEKTDAARCLEIAKDNLSDRKYDIVATQDDRIVGWAFIWNTDEPNEGTFGIGVSDDRQGGGIGREIMTRTLNSCKDRGIHTVHLIVVQDNKRAQNLYESMGFIVTGTKVGSDGQDYFTMIKRFAGSGV